MVSVDEKFSDVIRNKLSDIQFWQWVSTWKDPASIVEEAEGWDTKTKMKEIRMLRKVV